MSLGVGARSQHHIGQLAMCVFTRPRKSEADVLRVPLKKAIGSLFRQALPAWLVAHRHREAHVYRTIHFRRQRLTARSRSVSCDRAAAGT